MIAHAPLRTPPAVSEVFERNQRAWDAAGDAYQARHGPQLAGNPMAWGAWALPGRRLISAYLALLEQHGPLIERLLEPRPEGAAITDFLAELIIRSRRN